MSFWKFIKFLFGFGLLVFFAEISFAQQPDHLLSQRITLHNKIDQKQKFIDQLDGVTDSLIFSKDKIFSERATYTYLTLVDSLQKIIDDKNYNGRITYTYLLQLYGVIARVNIQNYHRIDYYEKILKNAYEILKHKEDAHLLHYLMKDVQSSVKNTYLFKEISVADSFLIKAAQLYPNEVLKELKSYADEPYALKIVEKAAATSPMAVKKYFNSKNLVNNFIMQSQDSVVKLIVDLFNTYGNESKVYYFTDMIYHDEASPNLMHSVSKNPLAYLGALIKARQRGNPIGDYDLENELKIKALEEVRKVNDLHEVNDSSVRFAAVKNMRPAELYTLMIYSSEEIFTSTFNGMFFRLLSHLRTNNMTGYELLESVSFNKFRTFIKQCAGYNSLETFLATMSEENALKLLRNFIAELHTEDGDISEAVNVADTFGSLDEPEYLLLFEEFLKEEFFKYSDEDESKVLYGLLLKLLYQKMNIIPEGEFSDSLALYILPSIESISMSELDSIHGTTQMHFFFDDDDGVTSFRTFIAAFRNAGFEIKEHEYFVEIRSSGKNTTTIYANFPKMEREGQAALSKMVEDDIIRPDIIVHRGHSYYVNYTISNIPAYAKVVFLGSCGGYHNISEVIKRAPSAHIISSKQIGTYTVNNSLLVEISKSISQNNQLNWTPLWNNLDKKLKGSGQSYERFLEYVPPHKNMGALFIQAFNQLSHKSNIN